MTMILITCEVLERCLPNVALFEIMVIGLDGYNFFELNMNDKWVTLLLLDGFRRFNSSILA